jgi:catechol 2,3-dioxygenase-like lactoylglutathione lyase family enzyme
MIQHVSLEVREEDAEACVAFWVLLGFREVDPPGRLGEITRWVERAGTQIHLLLTSDPVAPPQGHAAVVADDYDATLDRLRGAGFDPDPRTEHWGAPRSFVRDPAGHRVEVMAEPPPMG